MSCIDSKIRFPTCLPPVPIVASWPFQEKADGQVVEQEEQTRQVGTRSFARPGRPRPGHRYRAEHGRSQEDRAGPVGVPVRRLHAVPEDPQLPLERDRADVQLAAHDVRSEEHTSELQSLMRISYAVFCLK